MILQHPIWLLLIIPVAAAWLRWPLPSTMLRGLRGISLLLLVLAAAGPAVKLPSRAGTVVIAADRSRSMPPDAMESQLEAIRLIHLKAAGKDRWAVVSFGGEARVEKSPVSQGAFSEFTHSVDPDGSDLAGAIEKSLELIETGSPGRILLLTDGRWTGQDPQAAARLAAGRDIAIDYRLTERATAGDLAVSHIAAPSSVGSGESFLLTAWIQSPVQQEAEYTLRRGSMVIARGKQTLPSGLSSLLFRDRAAKAGTMEYVLTVQGASVDPVPENNRARVLIGAEGNKPILCVHSAGATGLSEVLRSAGLDVADAEPSHCQWSLEEVSNYSAVLLEDVPAEELTTGGMNLLPAWISQTGSGLMICGGKQSYGPGGYYRSPLEDILPVSMELRQEHRKLALAIVVAMDRSGSMAAPAGPGRTKMDLAIIAAVQVLDLLSSMDEFGVLAVDSSPHVIVSRAPLTNKAALRQKILSVESQGGGIFIYEALSAAAGMLADALPKTRHIILFADAADSEEPGRYQQLLEHCLQANITVSVIGLGSRGDVDAGLLEDIASRGKGQCYFTTSASELPRLFAQDTFMVARSAFLEEQTSVRSAGPMLSIARHSFDDLPDIGGYNLCYLRDGANLAAITKDEYQAPLIAFWQAGTGRVLCYTGQANGPYTGPMGRWPGAGELFSSMARWAAGTDAKLPPDMMLSQEVINGICQIRLMFSGNHQTALGAAPPKAALLRGRIDGKPEVAQIMLEWIDADTMGVDIPLRGEETSLAVVSSDGFGPIHLPPVCLPYSPEYAPTQPGQGHESLKAAARITGGTNRLTLDEVWNDMPRSPRWFFLSSGLLIMAVIVFLLEVLERRTGVLAAPLAVFHRYKVRVAAVAAPDASDSSEKQRHSKRLKKNQIPDFAPAATPPLQNKEESARESSLIIDSLQKAHQQAQARTRKHD